MNTNIKIIFLSDTTYFEVSSLLTLAGMVVTVMHDKAKYNTFKKPLIKKEAFEALARRSNTALFCSILEKVHSAFPPFRSSWMRGS